MPGDYDGDGKTDLAVFRPSTGTWYIKLSSSNYADVGHNQWGAGTDIPVAGDFDGDGKTDLGVYRPSTGTWYIVRSTTNYTTHVSRQWGLSGDIPVPGDFDGDGKADLAIVPPLDRRVVHPAVEHQLHDLRHRRTWGIGTDVPVPGDYDGDGKTDLAVVPALDRRLVHPEVEHQLHAPFSETALGRQHRHARAWRTTMATARPTSRVYRASTGTWYAHQSTTNNS